MYPPPPAVLTEDTAQWVGECEYMNFTLPIIINGKKTGS